VAVKRQHAPDRHDQNDDRRHSRLDHSLACWLAPRELRSFRSSSLQHRPATDVAKCSCLTILLYRRQL
jgi:hypothetical protein